MRADLSPFALDRGARGLLLAVALCALAAVCGAYGLPGRWLHWLAKPLATLGLFVLAARTVGAPQRYRRGVLAGLLASLLGDVLLMLPGDLFAAGLAAFLLAHLAYLSAFGSDVALLARRGPFFAYGLLAAALTALLWPGVPPGLRLPVLLYVVALATMAAQAGGRAAVLRTPGARAAAIGAALFVLCDASLAIDRFRWPYAAADALVLTSYWLAQAGIALSLWRAAPTRA